MVPKILHQITGPRQNFVVAHCLASWQRIQGKGFTINIWNDELLTTFISKEYPFALNAFLKARNHAEAADIARYLLVYHTGGIYMDWDVQLLSVPKFIQVLKDTPHGFLIQDPDNFTIASEAFSAQKKEPYLIKLVESIVELYEQQQRDTMATPEYSGPYRMRDALYNFTTKQALIPVNDIFVYNYREIRSMPERPIVQPLIHYWIHSWIEPSKPQQL